MKSDIFFETELTNKALDIIKKYFYKKKDLGGNPYIYHLIRVANIVKRRLENSPEFIYNSYFIETAYIIALFHDLFEDTNCTVEYLQNEGFDEDIIESVKILTRNKNENYFDYIKRVKQNNYAKHVKISDLIDNMDITRLNKFEDKDIERLKKYWKSYKYLTEEIELD